MQFRKIMKTGHPAVTRTHSSCREPVQNKPEQREYVAPVLESIDIQTDTHGKGYTVGVGETSTGGIVSPYGPS